MIKKGIVAFGEIFLLVSMSFAFTFILSESFGARVDGGGGVPTPLPGTYYRTPTQMPTGVSDNLAMKRMLEAENMRANEVLGPAGEAGGAGSTTILEGLFGGKAFGAGLGGALFSGLIWGAMIGGAGYLLAGWFGLTDKQAESIGLGLGVGGFAASTLLLYGQNSGLAAQGSFFFTPFGSILTGVGIAAAIIVLTWKEEKKELVRFECFPWEAPLGGSRCEECNNDPLRPCSEYRCKSLGQGCEIVNPGTTEEQCVWISKGDTAAPHMEPWVEALSPDGLRYTPDPPNRGFRILDSEGGNECLPAFTRLKFGVKTDEPAQCKIDYKPSDNFDKMNSFYMGESNLFLIEHAQQLKLVNSEAGNYTPEIGIDGTYTLWVRCIDANGNGKDSAMVAFTYCVDDGPDTTQPKIEGTSIESGSPVRYNADSVGIEVYVNEPAVCKWSRLDKAYEDMENSMECDTKNYQINADLNYVCSSQLTGIVNREDNWFYFRCEDKAGNIMTTSHPLLLKGTQELTISKVGPTGEFVGSTTIIPVTLEVETAHGASEGNATCSFSDGEGGRFVLMDNTRSHLHNQTLDLASGNYIYYFRCVDGGGNLATAQTNFSVTTDTTDPLITRVLKDGNSLKVITSEEAKCYYSQTNCEYETKDGRPLTYEDPIERMIHIAPWDKEATYYIKCEDFRGNLPRPDECQIIVKAGEL